MMEPNSLVLVVLVFLLAGGAVAGVALLRHVAIKVGLGVLCVALAAVGGMAVVNDFYGYYETWGQLSADLTGSYTSFANQHVTARHAGQVAAGRVVSVELPGKLSGIDRSGLVYLPPQYSQAAYRDTRFPVVELLHGTPGKPSDWVVHLRVAETLDRLIAEHLMGPVIVVMPTMSVGHDYQECVDAPGALDDTYITDDVRADVLARFRATTDPASWGIAGYSSGGYCAANLALRHRSSFGASGILDGYFRPGDGPAAAALHHNAAAERANNPLLEAAALHLSTSPLPAFWLSAGTGYGPDIAAARAFTKALHGVERVTLYREPGATHNFYAWMPAVPRMLAWMWTQLAPPDLRVRFPVAGSVTSSSIGGGTRSAARSHKP